MIRFHKLKKPGEALGLKGHQFNEMHLREEDGVFTHWRCPEQNHALAKWHEAGSTLRSITVERLKESHLHWEWTTVDYGKYVLTAEAPDEKS